MLWWTDGYHLGLLVGSTGRACKSAALVHPAIVICLCACPAGVQMHQCACARPW